MTATAPDDLLARLVHEIGLRTYADRFLDLNEEREVLTIAGRVGIPNAETEISRICREQGTVREAELRQTIRELLLREPGKLSEEMFVRIVDGLSNGMSDRNRQRQVIAVIDETKRPIKRGWFSNWYLKLKLSLGMP